MMKMTAWESWSQMCVVSVTALVVMIVLLVLISGVIRLVWWIRIMREYQSHRYAFFRYMKEKRKLDQETLDEREQRLMDELQELQEERRMSEADYIPFAMFREVQP
jgi:hypothetical protein